MVWRVNSVLAIATKSDLFVVYQVVNDAMNQVKMIAQFEMRAPNVLIRCDYRAIFVENFDVKT